MPSSGPRSGDSYAVVLSAFDDQNYYDQVGFASDYGCGATCGNPYDTWTVAYEQGTYGSGGGFSGCGWGTTSGGLSRDGTPGGYTGLGEAGWLTFVLYLPSNGYLYFRVYNGTGNFNGTPFFSYRVSDSAGEFNVTNFNTYCHPSAPGDTGYYSATVYEEVDAIASNSQSYPQWDFPFSDTVAAYWSGSSWGFTGLSDNQYSDFLTSAGASYPVKPHTYVVDYSESNSQIMIANEAADFAAHNTTPYVHPGSTATVSGSFPAIGVSATFADPTYHPRWRNWCINNTCNVSFTCTAPSGWSAPTYTATSTVPQPIWQYKATAPTTASAGWYDGGCTLAITVGSYTETTTCIMYINVSDSPLQFGPTRGPLRRS